MTFYSVMYNVAPFFWGGGGGEAGRGGRGGGGGGILPCFYTNKRVFFFFLKHHAFTVKILKAVPFYTFCRGENVDSPWFSMLTKLCVSTAGSPRVLSVRKR